MKSTSIIAAIERIQTTIAEHVTARHYKEHPELLECHGEQGKKRTYEDSLYNLSFLSQAIAVKNPQLFLDYLGWLKVVLFRRKVQLQTMMDHFEYLKAALKENLESEHADVACSYLDEALKRLPELPDEIPSFMDGESKLSLLSHQYLQALLRGDRKTASGLVLEAVEKGTSVKDIYLNVFQTCQYEIGRLWQTNEISVAQEHYCTAATQLIMSQLYPHIFSTEKIGLTLVATCVSGNLHELGSEWLLIFLSWTGGTPIILEPTHLTKAYWRPSQKTGPTY